MAKFKLGTKVRIISLDSLLDADISYNVDKYLKIGREGIITDIDYDSIYEVYFPDINDDWIFYSYQLEKITTLKQKFKHILRRV